MQQCLSGSARYDLSEPDHSTIGLRPYTALSNFVFMFVNMHNILS